MASPKEIYCVHGSGLYAIDFSGKDRLLSEGWTVVSTMTYAFEQVLAMQHETVFRVEPSEGKDGVHSRGWGSGDKLMATSGEDALLIDGRGRMFGLAEDGRYRYLVDGWDGTTAFVASQERFFAVDDGRLFEVSPDNGASRFLSDGWGPVTAAAAWGGRPYLIAPSSGSLIEVDPDDAKERTISTDWRATKHMTATDGKLFAVDEQTLYVIELDGAYSKLSNGWTRVQCLAAPGD